jgi:hypothetical protein
MLFEALHEARLDLLTEVSYLVGLRFSHPGASGFRSGPGTLRMKRLPWRPGSSKT